MAHLLRLRSLIAVQWPGLSALVPQWWPAMLYSVKNALAALMALGISLSVGLPMPFWAMTTVFIVANPVSAATRSKAIYRGLGTVIGAAVAVALVPLLVEAPLLLSLALDCWAISIIFKATIIGFPSVAQPEAVFDVAAARVTEILLGIACATVVHSLIMPDSLGGRLGPRLEAWLGDAEKWLHDILAGGSGLATVAVDRDRRRLAVDALDCQLLASHVPYDTSHWREANRTVQALLYRMLLLLPILSGLADRRRGLGDDRGLQPALATARTWLEQGADPARQPDLLAKPLGAYADLHFDGWRLRLGVGQSDQWSAATRTQNGNDSVGAPLVASRLHPIAGGHVLVPLRSSSRPTRFAQFGCLHRRSRPLYRVDPDGSCLCHFLLCHRRGSLPVHQPAQRHRFWAR